ncbi:hypothetical protein V3C99_013507 [Haemonchus contortus]
MIGMVNVQCDSPIDFYAAAPLHESPRSSCDDDSRPPLKRTPSYRPLFMSHKHKVTYSKDGRKMTDGVLVEKAEPNKLWEELILRSFVNRFEDEIQSPVESYKTLESELEKLNVKGIPESMTSDKSLYRSTYSLVSPHRVEGVKVHLDETEPSQPKHKRSFTMDLKLPLFIKPAKGTKKSDKKK